MNRAPRCLDERRFTEMFETYHGAVLAYVRRRIGDLLAPDVVAETFLAAWRNLDALPPTPLPWLYRAAAFELGHVRRRIGQERRLTSMTTEPAPHMLDPADAVTDADEWATAFRLLGESDKEVLRLVAWEGVSPAEGAFVFGCSVSSFKVRLHRARRRLVRLLEANNRSIAPSSATNASLRRPLDAMPPALRICADQAAAAIELAHQPIRKETR
jgi:RNA polymerase sigma-70 factor, ECF subfamily